MKSLGWKKFSPVFYSRVLLSKTDTVDSAAIFKKVLNGKDQEMLPLHRKDRKYKRLKKKNPMPSY